MAGRPAHSTVWGDNAPIASHLPQPLLVGSMPSLLCLASQLRLLPSFLALCWRETERGWEWEWDRVRVRVKDRDRQQQAQGETERDRQRTDDHRHWNELCCAACMCDQRRSITVVANISGSFQRRLSKDTTLKHGPCSLTLGVCLTTTKVVIVQPLLVALLRLVLPQRMEKHTVW